MNKYDKPGFDFALAWFIEECGEALHAAGKTQRWGRTSFNPDLPRDQQETNEAWLRREAKDVIVRAQRLIDEIDGHYP